MRDSRNRSRRAIESPAAMLERLEPRVHLSAFAYTSLTGYLDEATPLFTLRPAGENAPPPTIASSVAAAGDIDGDGIPDILVGSGGRHNENSAVLRATAAVYSGQTGALLLSFSDGFTEFGAAGAGVGDVNGDGVPDLLVGSPRWGQGPGQSPGSQIGRAYVYSGADGSVLYTLTGASAGDRFGEAVAAAGDVDGDGVPDFIIGAPGADGGGSDRGAASIYSGADGSLIRTLTGAADRGRFGASLAGAGDLDGDGKAEVIIGAPHATTGNIQSPGRVFVYSGADGAELFSFSGAQNRDQFGFAVAGGSDMDGDGVADIIVGAPGHDVPGPGAVPNAGRVVVYSGADGSVLRTFIGDQPNGNLGAAVAFAGDTDSDGYADLLIGKPSANPEAAVLVYSGGSGALLAAFVARTSNLVGSDRLGTAVAALGDITGDGIPDFVFAGTQDANPGRNDRSRMYVFSGAPAANLQPRGINDDLAIWGGTGVNGADFLILNGELFMLAAREGFMPGDRVIDVSNNDVVLGARTSGGSEPFLWIDGVRTELADLIVTFDGPTGDFDGLRAVDITDAGLVLVERLRDGTTPTTWVLDEGTLRYLFDGTPIRLNASGAAVGLADGSAVDSVLWTSADGATIIAGIAATDLSDGGVIVGTARVDGMPGSLRAVKWLDGVTTVLGVISGGDGFTPTAVSSNGQIVGIYETEGGGFASFFYDSAGGIRDITPLVIDPPPAFTASARLILADINSDGIIVGAATDLGAGFVLTPSAGDAGLRARIDGRIETTLPRSGSYAVVSLNAAGDIITYRRDPATGEWTAWNLTEIAGAPRATEVSSFTYEETGQVFFVAVASDGLYLISERATADGVNDGLGWAVRNLTVELDGATPIVRGLTVFMSDGRSAMIAGLDGAGDVVVYKNIGAEVIGATGEVRLAFEFENISEVHLRPGGFESPAFEGRLVSFVTAWNSMHIAGLDEDGQIWAVWTAPSLAGRWESVNLSAITGAPVLVGGLTPFLTAWGGIHIAGTDMNGDTTVTWWVPGFEGRWEKNNITREFAFDKLRPESVSSFVTPWGGLNIAGLNDRGEVAVYWWSPESSTWQIDGIDVERPDPNARPLRRLDGFSGRDNAMNLFGVGPGGEILRLHWQPGDQWRFENLTVAARG